MVTGAAGFAGSHLADYLLSQGEDVVALIAPQDELLNLNHVLSRIVIERVDIQDAEGVLRVLSNTRPQRIYHLAALSSPVESLRDPLPTYKVNFYGTLNLLYAWRQLDMDCRLLYVSSGEVYGTDPPGPMPLREDCPWRPANPYAASKAAGELLAFQFYKSYGFPIVRVRPFNHTGPRQTAAFVCSSLAKQIVEIEVGLRPPTMTVGNLNVQRDFSDVRDIVRGYHLLLEKGEPGDVYQLCSGRPVSIESIVEILISFITKPVRVAVDESKVRTQEAPALWGDPTKAKQAVGWLPQYALETTLRDLRLSWEEALRAQRLAGS
jgi:GDP-4-dehydro-6-deoxy-D-mannose reductase